MEDELPRGDYPHPIRIVRGHEVREAKWDGWMGDDKGVLKTCAYLFLGHQIGLREFSLAHGHGRKLMKAWHIHPDDLAKLRAWALESWGRRIEPMPLGTGRPRKPRTGKRADPRQIDLFK